MTVNTDLDAIPDEQLKALIAEHGVTKAADMLGFARSTIRDAAIRRGIRQSGNGHGRSAPCLTRSMIDQAMLPANNCTVKAFRDMLPDEQRDAFDYALAQNRRDLSGGGLHKMLIDAGYDEAIVPTVNAINDHRRGEKPCRCKDQPHA